MTKEESLIRYEKDKHCNNIFNCEECAFFTCYIGFDRLASASCWLYHNKKDYVIADEYALMLINKYKTQLLLDLSND